jgi:hypothetical protein
MLMQEIDQWKNENNLFGCELGEEHFYMFFQDKRGNYDAFQTAAYLAQQVYELQVCIEGLLEDMEYLNGQKNQKTQKEDRSRYGCTC